LHVFDIEYIFVIRGRLQFDEEHGEWEFGSVLLNVPKTHSKARELKDYYNTLERRFFAGGDCNAKHTDWRSRLITPRGCELFNTMERNNLKHLSTGEPTYWPSDRNKLPI
jgi:hypothetical protein